MKLDYSFLSTKDLENVWALEVSKDGLIALIGFGRDEAGLLQINLEKKEVIESYYLQGRYVLSIDFISKSIAVAGTNNGYLALINLDREEVIDQNKVINEDDSIKCIKYFEDKDIIVAVSSKKAILINANNLKVIDTYNLDFNPWDICVIPNSNIIAISGEKNKIELFNVEKLEFSQIESVSCGNESKDVSAIMFNSKYKQFISTSESGNVDIWNISNNGLEKQLKADIKDNVYWGQTINDYLAFSSSSQGAYIINLLEKSMTNIPKSKREGRIHLNEVNGTPYLLYLTQRGDIRIAGLENIKDNLNIHSIDNLSDEVDGVDFIHLTCRGDIIAVSSEAIVLANIVANNDTEKNKLEIEKFIFNSNNNSILLQCKDETLKRLSLENEKIESMNLPDGLNGLSISDFVDDKVLMTGESKTTVFSWANFNPAKNIDIGASSRITDAKIINHNSYAVQYNADRIGEPYTQTDEFVNIFTLEGKKINKSIEQRSIFVCHNKLLLPNVGENSMIIDFNTGSEILFNIGWDLSKDSTLISCDLKYCFHILGEMSCTDLDNKNKKVWKVKDPRLFGYKPIAHSQFLNAFLIFNEEKNILIEVAESSGNFVKSWELPKGIIEEIIVSSSGEHIAWKTKNGKFSMCSFSGKMTDMSLITEITPWRQQKHNTDKEDFLFLENKNLSVGDLWKETYERVIKQIFKSSSSPHHQLNPWDFSLSIPSVKALNNYNDKKTIKSLLGLANDSSSGNKELETICHEIFHVFQSSSTRSVFDYFYYIDNIQKKRVSILEYLGHMKFFSFASDDILEQCFTIFHCADHCNNQDLKKLSDLNRRNIEELIRYFENPKDLDLNTFELMEGSAEVFGLCCGGFNAFSKLDIRLENLKSKSTKQDNAELYLKVYRLFKENGGKTPIVFIILCLSALKYGLMNFTDNIASTPADIFSWCLKKLSLWEDDFKGQIVTQELENNFSTIVCQFIEKISASITGHFYLPSSKSIHDKKDKFDEEITPFMQGLVNIRSSFEQFDNLNFLVDLISDKKYFYTIAEKFNVQEKKMEELLRVNQVVRDYENILMQHDFNINCCYKHKKVSIFDSKIWDLCETPNNFKNILLNKFNITIPETYFE